MVVWHLMVRLLHAFIQHRIAPNLIILLMILSGIFVVERMEIRFFPEFSRQMITVKTSLPYASTENVNNAVIIPLENQLRNITALKKMSSVARTGVGVIYLEFPENISIDAMTKEVRRYIDLAKPNLPSDSKTPKISVGGRHENIMRLALIGAPLEQLRRLARQLQNELISLNITEVEVSGLPTSHLEIRVNQQKLQESGRSLREISQQIRAQNVNTTAADIAGSYSLRADNKTQNISLLKNIIISDSNNQQIRLGDFATIERRLDENSSPSIIYFNGVVAVEFLLKQKTGGNSVDSAKKITDWLDKKQASLPPNIQIIAHNQRWKSIQSRINLLIKNGSQGLILVLIILFIFLNARVAFWVAIGIPATMMVALAFLYSVGESINMISLFAFIMVTGLVVDDAIVVGENALYHHERGLNHKKASLRGAVEMLPSVVTSTFTTIASFFPILLIGGTIGSIIFAIPMVVISVLVASLFECFFVLPGHLSHTFNNMNKKAKIKTRQSINQQFLRFQNHIFRPSVLLALKYRWVTLALMLFILFLTISLIMSGALRFRFFPGAELSRVQAQVTFVAGTPVTHIEKSMRNIEKAAAVAANKISQDKPLLKYSSIYLGKGGYKDRGKEHASLVVELTPPNERDISTRQFTREWQKYLKKDSRIEKLSLRESRGGPAGEDLEIRLNGKDADSLKAAAIALKALLPSIKGVSAPTDDMPYGKQQLLFSLTSKARLLNLSVESIANQLQGAINGYHIQTLYKGLDETELRLLLDTINDQSLNELNLNNILIQTPDKRFLPLADLVTITRQSGFNTISRINSQSIINVIADIDFKQTEVAPVLEQLENDILPDIVNQYGVGYSFEGSQSDEKQTTDDMKYGLVLTFICIFVLLTAAFSSWTLPLVIILTIPFGVIGAMLGHWLMGYDMSILSAFGVFALNGIIINDSIILVRDYIARKNKPYTNHQTIIADTACRRLRAIFLTSLTTIVGLVPLIFESSIQAQFLIPMAISIAFGLGFATFLILYLTPVLLSIHHSIHSSLTADTSQT